MKRWLLVWAGILGCSGSGAPGAAGRLAQCDETCGQAARSCPDDADADDCRRDCAASTEEWVWASVGTEEDLCAVVYVGPRSGVPCDTFRSLPCIATPDSGPTARDAGPIATDDGGPPDNGCADAPPPSCEDEHTLVECRDFDGIRARQRTICERGCWEGRCRCDAELDLDYCDGDTSVSCANSGEWAWYRSECPGACEDGTCI
jgi:hypothetical protein